MKKRNNYYTIAFAGAAITLAAQLIAAFTIDPYLAAVFTPFYSVWLILLVVGWRKDHPQR
ncbi:hypothetical protein FVR03_02635 [Pontibacter qinzhouensis]|uniref:Uncharacterized protein n=1 Tax=Pontibacter qinzhouensis TaxID=2603253 RepID=A0A5C8KEH7_9BACT|nr:hypothetical protein [Pontibacter qinzhouensis]TXK51996.1 hypothetical protein FVR03_02635 [Pontibacter qinzhouensis]